MILILSEERDVSTDNVCKWLNYQNKKFVRINIEDHNRDFERLLFEKGVILSDKKKKGSDIFGNWDSIWCRRGTLPLLHISEPKSSYINEKSFNDFLKKEYQIFTDFLYSKISHSKHFNLPNLYNVNKIKVLEEALKVGLNIPNTIITNNRKSIVNSKFKFPLICKPISDLAEIDINHEKYNKILFKLNRINSFNEIPVEFEFTLFQELISKKYDLRIFFIENNFISCAILNTALDSRNIAYRVVPFNLPIELKRKLQKLNKKIKLNSGSIDMVVSKDNIFIFLEINPVGQFEFYNNKLDLGISKLISEKL
jgi:hypothetical protein